MAETRLVAIHGGGDWADASADYINLPNGLLMEDIKKAWNAWYFDLYLPQLRQNNKTPFFGLVDYAINFYGATPADIEIYQDGC